MTEPEGAPEQAAEPAPSAQRAGTQAAWTFILGFVAYLIVTVIVGLIQGARISPSYLVGLINDLGITPIVWGVFVVGIAVRYREEPARRRAQLATGAGLIAGFIDGLIRAISAAASGALGTAAFAIVPVIIGIVIFVAASAIGAYGSIPIVTRGEKKA